MGDAGGRRFRSGRGGSVWVKFTYFPGYPTFASNFSGNNWDHVTPTLVLNRIVYLLLTPRALLTVAAAPVALACFSWRYVVASILISPLIAAHLLAVRDNLAKLPLYYVHGVPRDLGGAFHRRRLPCADGTVERWRPSSCWPRRSPYRCRYSSP